MNMNHLSDNHIRHNNTVIFSKDMSMHVFCRHGQKWLNKNNPTHEGMQDNKAQHNTMQSICSHFIVYSKILCMKMSIKWFRIIQNHFRCFGRMMWDITWIIWTPSKCSSPLILELYNKIKSKQCAVKIWWITPLIGTGKQAGDRPSFE